MGMFHWLFVFRLRVRVHEHQRWRWTHAEYARNKASLDCLADVEVQLCIQYLDLLTLDRLTSCSKRLQHLASTPFARKYSHPLVTFIPQIESRSYPDDEDRCVVISHGSCMSRVGFVYSNEILEFPSIVAYYYKRGYEPYFGHQAEVRQHQGYISKVERPIVNGIMTGSNSNGIYFLRREGLQNMMRVSQLYQVPMLYTDSPLNTLNNRIDLIASLFSDEYQCPAVAMVSDAEAALFSCGGLTTGCVVSCGHEVTNIVPILRGRIIRRAIVQIPCGGAHIHSYLRHLSCLPCSKAEYHKDGELDHTHVTLETMPENALTTCHELWFSTELWPPFSSIDYFSQPLTWVSFERMPDIPSRIDLQSAIIESISRCPEETQGEMWSHLVLAGAPTTTRGFDERLTKELLIHASMPHQYTKSLQIVNSGETSRKLRKHASWLGAASLARQPAFRSKWVTRAEYESGDERWYSKLLLVTCPWQK